MCKRCERDTLVMKIEKVTQAEIVTEIVVAVDYGLTLIPHRTDNLASIERKAEGALITEEGSNLALIVKAVPSIETQKATTIIVAVVINFLSFARETNVDSNSFTVFDGVGAVVASSGDGVESLIAVEKGFVD